MTNRTCRTVYANNYIGELSKKGRPVDLYVSKVKKKGLMWSRLLHILIFTMYGAYFNNKMIVHLVVELKMTSGTYIRKQSHQVMIVPRHGVARNLRVYTPCRNSLSNCALVIQIIDV